VRGNFLSGAALPAVLLAAWSFPTPASAWFDAKKRKLDEIQSELKAARAQIVLYQQMEESLTRQTQSLEDSRAKINDEMGRLKRELRTARANRRLLEGRLQAVGRASGLWRPEMRSELRTYSDDLWDQNSRFGSLGIWRELLLQRAVMEQAAVLKRLNGLDKAEALGKKQKQREEGRILTQRQQVQARARKTDAQYQDTLAQIATTQQKKAAALAREKALEASAKALTRLIRRLRQSQRLPRALPSVWSVTKNSLPWPAAGHVMEAFGRRRDPATGVWMLSRGILIATQPDVPVAAVGDAQVIYAGSFRSYGRVLILDHGGNFFSIYGHLGQLLASQGQSVKTGDVIARAGSLDGGSLGSVYLEIRQGTQALNPLDWLEKP